jgi:hypothetical protein
MALNLRDPARTASMSTGGMLSAARGSIKGTSAYNESMGKPERAFVLLRHETTEGVHWDLMLDVGPSLATWQLVEDPAASSEPRAGEGIPARLLPEHRREYLDYEGPVSRNRGYVTRSDHGTYRLLTRKPAAWTILLTGEGLSGRFRLSAVRPGATEWLFQRLD